MSNMHLPRNLIRGLGAGVLCLLAALAQAAPSQGSSQNTGPARPPIVSWNTPQGARVLFLETRALPLLDVSVVFDAGSRRDPTDRLGLAAMTQGLLNSGAAELDEQAIATRFSELAAQYNSSASDDMALVSLRVLSQADKRDPALALLADILQRPTFPEPALQRERARLIQAIRQAKTQPAAIAGKALAKLMYPQHRYGDPGEGTEETLARITSADLKSYWQTHYQPAHALVVLVGDVSRAEAEKIADRLLAGLPQGGAPLPSMPPVEAAAQGQRQVWPHPASQAHIMLGTPVLSRDDPDYFPLVVGNYVLGGGGFDSRLNKEVRDKRGLAYSVYSSFAPQAQPGPFSIAVQTKKEQAGLTLDLLNSTLQRFIEEGPTARELAQAKNNLTGGFPLRIDSNAKLLSYLVMIGFYRQPLSYFDDYVRAVEQVTVEQVRDAFRRRVHPQALHTVVVGPERLEGVESK